MSYCPKCGSNDLVGAQGYTQNMFCNKCGFFPIPFPSEIMKQFEEWWKTIVHNNSFVQAKDYSEAAFRAGYEMGLKNS